MRKVGKASGIHTGKLDVKCRHDLFNNVSGSSKEVLEMRLDSKLGRQAGAQVPKHRLKAFSWGVARPAHV